MLGSGVSDDILKTKQPLLFLSTKTEKVKEEYLDDF